MDREGAPQQRSNPYHHNTRARYICYLLSPCKGQSWIQYQGQMLSFPAFASFVFLIHPCLPLSLRRLSCTISSPFPLYDVSVLVVFSWFSFVSLIFPIAYACDIFQVYLGFFTNLYPLFVAQLSTLTLRPCGALFACPFACCFHFSALTYLCICNVACSSHTSASQCLHSP